MADNDSNVIDFQSAAQLRAAASVDASPDDAARAMQLGRTFGAPAQAIANDLPRYEESLKSQAANQIIKGNNHLQDYINAHPLHAAISNDDWHNLDDLSEKVKALPKYPLAEHMQEGQIGGEAAGVIAWEAAKGFAKGAFGEPYLSWFPEYQNNLAALAIDIPFESFFKYVQGAVGAVGGVTAGLKKIAGGTEKEAAEAGEIIGGSLGEALIGLTGMHVPEVGKATQEPLKLSQAVLPWIKANDTQLTAFFKALKTFDGNPPAGIHPWVDAIYKAGTERDIKALDEAVQAANRTETGKRDSQVLSDFNRLENKGDIRISADAVRKLYGEAEPEAEDGKLGWVPDIVRQLGEEEEHGGDITVPIADWIAKVDPKIAKELREDIKFRPEGLTLNEAKELPKPKFEEEEPAQIKNATGEDAGNPEFYIKDEAVKALRKSVGIESKFERTKPKTYQLKEGEEWVQVTPNARIAVKASYTENDLAISDAVDAELKKFGITGAKITPTANIEQSGRSGMYGLYYRGGKYSDAPLIAYTLESPDAVGTFRHEVIHYLRDMDFFRPEEWALLESTALKEDWIQKHNIDIRYSKLNNVGQLEEAIAEEFKQWNRYKESSGREEPITEHHPIFEKLKRFIEGLRDALYKIYGRRITSDDLFAKIERGEAGEFERRQGLAKAEGAEPKFEEGESDIVRWARSRGATLKQAQRYERLIEAEHEATIERARQKAEDAARKHQTTEWKANAKDTERQVRKDFTERPDLAAAEFFQKGTYGGEKLTERPKINSDYLTPEQRKALPEEYLAEGKGNHPDDVAGLFGYNSGDSLIDHLALVEKDRRDAGLQPKEFYEKLVKDETARRMEAKYGDLQENILEEAKDQVLGKPTLDRVYHELLLEVVRSGEKAPFTKEDYATYTREQFDKLSQAAAQTSDKYLGLAGKWGRKIELVGGTGKIPSAAEALRAKEQQYLNLLWAKEARKLENEQKQFDKIARKYASREVNGIQTDYLNWVHDILMKVGKDIERRPDDLDDAISRADQDSLEKFVAAKKSMLREIPVADLLFGDRTAKRFEKSFDQYSVEDFRAVLDSLKTLIKNGRDEQKLEVSGGKADLRDLIDNNLVQEIARLKEVGPYPAGSDKWFSARFYIKSYIASSLQLESWFNRFDLNNPRGPFNRFIVRTFTSAADYEDRLLKRVSRQLKALGDFEDEKKKIENNFWMDPLSRTDKDDVTSGTRSLVLTRKEVMGILAHAGNPENWAKLTKGYGVDSQRAWQWLIKNTTKEDWKWMQKHGEIFKQLKKEGDKVFHAMSNVPAQNIRLWDGLNRTGDLGTHPELGKVEGWYHPLIAHPFWEGEAKAMLGGDAIEQSNFVSASTPRNYEKQRTGAIYPLDLSFDSVPRRIQQEIHDISHREAIVELSKVFLDKAFRAAVTKHFGAEYRDQLVPFLKALANNTDYMSRPGSLFNNAVGIVRGNVIGNLIGFNPYTVIKHGAGAFVNSVVQVGPVNYLKWQASILSKNPETAESNWATAKEKFNEIGRRHQFFQDTIYGSHPGVAVNTWKEVMQYAGSTPIAFFDMMSAIPTAFAAYEKAIKTGADEGQAIFEANRAVRHAHGSTAIHNRPAIMRGNALAQTFTSLYGFFNQMLQRQYMAAWMLKEGGRDLTEGQKTEAFKKIGHSAMLVFSSVIVPTITEEELSPYTNDEHQSWGQKAWRYLRGLTSGLVGVRDLSFGLESGHETAAGLAATATKELTDFVVDIEKKGFKNFSAPNRAKAIRDTTTAIGLFTGIPMREPGKALSGLSDYGTGLAHPKNVPEWWRLLTTGTTKEIKR